MSKARRNPSSFSDALTEKYYAKRERKKTQLKQKREERVSWLRKKYKDDKRAQKLADELEECRVKRRCKSLACPECAYAAQQLFVTAVSNYLKGKSDVVCVTIIPANEAIKSGKLS